MTQEFTDEEIKEYINYTPAIVKFLNKDENTLAEKFPKIIDVLRKKNMTVKEIHNIFYDQELKTHSYAIKTIYRHLEELERAGLVSVAGFRETKGSRKAEKLYTKSAIIFFQQMDEEYKHYKKDVRKKIVHQLYVVLGEMLQRKDIDFEKFSNFMHIFLDKQHLAIDSIINGIQENQTLADLYGEMDPEYISVINTFSAIFITLLNNPSMFKVLEKLYK
jgi:Fe2+ or Zn2+ uptake regulation protein